MADWECTAGRWNMHLLVAFTIFESIAIGTLSALYQERGLGEAVALAWYSLHLPFARAYAAIMLCMLSLSVCMLHSLHGL